MNLENNWQVISSEDISENGSKISVNSYNASSWYKVKIPSTVLDSLVQNGVYKNILDGLTLKTINPEPFTKPWWYRTRFDINTLAKNSQLKINGVNYRADIWLNGKKIATKKNIYGPFRQFQIDVSSYLQPGTNVLAMKVYPPKPSDFRIGFADWNPNPPDKNMGLFRGVLLTTNNGIEVKEPFVETNLNSPKNDIAKLTVHLTVINHQENQATTNLKLKINKDSSINKTITLEPHEVKHITFTEKNHKSLRISYPKLWWPNKMGQPNLYKLTVKASQNNIPSDKKTIHFGIRKIESLVNSYQEKGKKDLSYYRLFKINGKKVLIRGAAWTDSMLLNNSKQNVKAQLAYAKAMNLNTIRLEGFWGSDATIYDTCDKLGLLVMIGYSAQWEWPLRGFRKKERCDLESGCYNSVKDQKVILDSFTDQFLNLRNHPSIFVWMFGSDFKPRPELEEKLAKTLTKLNPNVPYVISAAEKKSAWNNKPSGMKMRSPYIYVPPIYWYSNINQGGAFGFNSETSPGAEVPPIESLKKMIADPEKYWPNNNDVWVYHEGGHPSLQTLSRYNKAMTERYGAPKSLEEYAYKAQLMNYESIRPMFEAFSVYKTGNPLLEQVPATGVIHWMLNAAWPKFFWQLYDYYLVPGSAYFSAKEANSPLHIIYNYEDSAIYLNNNTLKNINHLKVTARIWDANSKLISEYKHTTNLTMNNVKKLGKLKGVNKVKTSIYFVELNLTDDKRNKLDHNVYWLSKDPDKMGADTDIIHNANFQELNKMPKANLKVDYKFSNHQNDVFLVVKIKNPSDKIAFFKRLTIRTKNHAIISPIFWNDNFITLFPHQSRTIKAHFKQSALQGESPIFSLD
ncbi:MAG: glycoside hydrolase family 2 TIM barrel-domain containing protein [Legionellaceae bacterium]|nr:glycoside hydrolase family 2 TIM barrel-domain containing protein [Legionellaceae bacterium]